MISCKLIGGVLGCWLVLLGFSGAAYSEIERSDVEGIDILSNASVERGRLVFGPCRTCHYAQEFMGHNNGPNLHRIFGKVVGKQPEFSYYSEVFKKSDAVWTPELLYLWLADPQAMFPGSNMMSLGVPEPQKRADLIAFLKVASQGPGTPAAEVTEVTEVSEVSEVSEVAEVAEVAEVSEVAEVTEVSEVAELTEVTKVTEVAEDIEDTN